MWEYKGTCFTEDMIGNAVGFVYEILNKTNGKRYIGKKLFTKSKSYQKKGKRKTRRVASDWMTYTGSNDLLNEDIENGHNIEKRILHLCPSRGWLSYMETKEIFDRSCLTDPDYYNTWVSVRIRSSHLK